MEDHIADVVAPAALLAGYGAGKIGAGLPVSGDCVIIVFAKAPVAGYAKTRLARVLGNEAAARLASRMLAHAVAAAAEADIGPVELWCAPDTSHAAFEESARRFGVTCHPQGEGDLGARMQRAFSQGLIRYRAVLLVGTDAPALGPAEIRAAACGLRTAPAVFAPAADGGYVLAGLTRPAPELFADMVWSTCDVMSKTRERLLRIGMPWTELPLMHDVDEPEDLIHLPREWLE